MLLSHFTLKKYFKGLDKYVEIPEQKLETTTRKGFVVIEWGGSEL